MTENIATILLRLYLLLLGMTSMYPLVAREGIAQTRVAIRLIDGETGLPTPAMAAVINLDDKTLRLPPDGRPYTGPGVLVDEFQQGYAFEPDPNWIGPVRKMAGKGDNNNRSYVYGLAPSVPYWHEPFAYQTSGDFSIVLEPGRYRLAAMRGNEFIPVREEFEITGGHSEEEKMFVLKRWINLPEKGWYSGDVHVHHPTTREAFREFLLHYAIASDVHVVNVLAKRQYEEADSGGMDHWNMLTRQAGWGNAYRVQRGNYVLVPGQEHPQSVFGHITGMNIQEMTRPDLDDLDLYDLTFNALHDQGAVVGFAHFAWNGTNMPRGFPIYVTTGGIDFIELLQFRHLNAETYYEYLNLGIKLSAAAASDVPYGSTLGEVRTYVYTGEAFDVDEWFDGLKAGRTFVSNGPALEFTVDGRLPGAELDVESGHQVHVELTVSSHPSIGTPLYVQLIGPDGVIREFRPDQEGASIITGDADVPINRSQWLVASTVCDNGAVAHTSPVYLIVNEQPFYHPGRAPALIQKRLEALADTEEWVNGWEKGMRKSGVLERLQRAEQLYQSLHQMVLSGR